MVLNYVIYIGRVVNVKRLVNKMKFIIAFLVILALNISNVFASDGIINGRIKSPAQQSKQIEKITLKEGSTINGLKEFNLSQSDKKLSETEATNLSSNKKPGNTLMTDATAQAAENHDPNSAIYIDLDTVYNDTLTAEGQSNWYYVNVPTAGKLTAYMQTLADPNIDYDLTLYTYNTSSGTLENPINSQYGPTTNEQLSSVIQPGYYFVCINSYSGFDSANPYYFIIKYSQTYDSGEPDDNIAQARQKTDNYFVVNQTLDNQFDVDWIYLSLSVSKSLFMTLGNVPTECTYKLDVFDSNLNGIGTLSQNTTALIELQPGTYYFRVSTENGSGSGYSLTVTEVANTVSSVYGHSLDWKYILYKTPSGELFANDNSVTVSGSLKWERDFIFSYNGKFTRRDQVISRGIDKISGPGVFGAYTSNYTGSINNSFRIPITNALYLYFYSHFESGVNTIYEEDWTDVTGMPTPRYTDSYDDTYFGPLYLIIDADTGTIKDLYAKLNFYYYHDIEIASFTPES